MDLYLVAFVAGAFFIAGFVKGMVGMGLPPISMGLLAILFPPAQAAALVLVPAFVTNIWQMTAGRKLLAVARRFLTLVLGILLGTWIGADVLTSFESKLPSVLLGFSLVIYAALGIASVRFHVARAHEVYWSPVIGVLSGIVLAATGVMGVPLIPYLYALDLDKEELLQSLGLTFVVAAVALAVVLFEAGVLRINNATGSALSLIPTAIGMLAGRYVLKRINADTFRLIFLIGLGGLGVLSAVKGLL